MSTTPFKIDVSPRIQRLPPYLFGRINKMKYEKRVNGVDIIDLGMGNPTDPTPEVVVKRLQEAALDPRNHRYSVSNGLFNLRREAALRYERLYGVSLNPETEVIAGALRRVAWMPPTLLGLTLSLGVRAAFDLHYVPAQSKAAGVFVQTFPAQSIAEYKPDYWNTINPRLHAAYDVTGDGKTVIKGGWGRFAPMRNILEAAYLSPIGLTCSQSLAPISFGVSPCDFRYWRKRASASAFLPIRPRTCG